MAIFHELNRLIYRYKIVNDHCIEISELPFQGNWTLNTDHILGGTESLAN